MFHKLKKKKLKNVIFYSFLTQILHNLS